ncbi:MAG: heavy metal translocating P-type ATPase [Hyphomicrobiaceae bacterium]
MAATLTANTQEVARAERETSASSGHTTTFAVPGMHCGGCMRTVESALAAVPGVTHARANLSARRVAVVTAEKPTSPEALLAALAGAGFPATVLRDDTAPSGANAGDAVLLRCLGVAGFAAANIMLLSVSVWSGHAGDMPVSLQTAFHWLSAAIAVPAVAYAGRPFFASARAALAAGRLNMDVPISLGVILATAMSLYQTLRGTSHVFFDAAITLLFFLLIGRVIDQRMRVRAAGAAENLLGLRSPVTTVVQPDGHVERMATSDVQPGMRVLVAAGERIPVDGRLVAGRSSLDESLMTGETTPRTVAPGDRVHCGTINLLAPLELIVTATAENTLLADIARLMTAAEQARGTYVRLADRAARLYAPAVHALGFATFAGWMIAGQGWEPALTAAIAVLIITCPCALALAVPAVQVVATSRLFRNGVVIKSADALERLAEIDTIILDKTGTLTRGVPDVVGAVDDRDLAIAAALAVQSRHPYAQAIAAAARERGLSLPKATGVTEEAGAGLAGTIDGEAVRLGSARFCGVSEPPDTQALHLRLGDGRHVAIAVRDTLRRDATEVVRALTGRGLEMEILSGDRHANVAAIAATVGIARFEGEATPAAKIARIEALKRQGRRVLMIGDGLNDAPALAAGHASMSPASATDISQTAADAVFQGERLAPIVATLAVARAAQQRARQNLAIAIGYNIVFVPLAVAGLVTPLIAAVAMSASSLAVTANALRLANQRLGEKP